MSRDTRLMLGLSLLLVPTIVFGGLTLLGVLTSRLHGLPGPTDLTPLQQALYRAGHAHAGALMLLSLALQALLDHVALPRPTIWPLRISAPLSAVLISGGFFGVAHLPGLRVVLYTGIGLVLLTTISIGVGLVRASRRLSP